MQHTRYPPYRTLDIAEPLLLLANTLSVHCNGLPQASLANR